MTPNTIYSPAPSELPILTKIRVYFKDTTRAPLYGQFITPADSSGFARFLRACDEDKYIESNASLNFTKLLMCSTILLYKTS